MALGKLQTEGDLERWLGERLKPLTTLTRQLQGGVLAGEGTPEGNVSAPPSVLYRQKDGSAGTLLWQKQTGTGPTGWAAIA